MTRNRSFQYCTVLMAAFLIQGMIRGQESTAQHDRSPAFAGTFYPGNKQALNANLKELFATASPASPEGRIRTLIVPHAGYPYSGVVAASGYKTIPQDAHYKNIFIIASSHREHFAGASVYAAGNYLTPLGVARVNRQVANTLIRENRNISFLEKAHDREHSIEVQIPFLQYHFPKLPPIVPIVMGTSSPEAARSLATALMPYFTPENLFIISSDFSHYPAYKDAVRLDRLTGEAILKKDPELFYRTLQKNSREPVPNLATPCCGWSSILTMLYMAERTDNMEFSPVIYKNSGDSPIGDKNRVVGYWAIAGYETTPGSDTFTLNEQEKETLLKISRNTLETYIQTGDLPRIEDKTLPPALKQETGAFVTLHMGGRLRGCIGNFAPDKPLYMVVQEMTVAAATRDIRFAPVEPPELPYIHIEISVLTPLKKIESIDEFQPGKHGIYITKDGRSGTYLPQVAVETGWNREELLGHCSREKAKIGWDGWKEADLYVYEAIVFEEENKQ